MLQSSTLRCCALLLALCVAGPAPDAAAGPIERSSEGECAPRSDASASAARDLSCYVTTRELTRWREAGDLVIVDPRPAAEFRRVRIPGSINLPLRSLAHRDYLKTRRILLVDRGHASGELEAGCRELRGAGFASVGIIEGGLNAWSQSMGDLEGDRLARAGLSRIPARELARATRLDHWLVLDVSEAGAPELRELFPGVVHVPLRGDPAEFRRQLGRVIQARERGPGALFLAIVEADDGRHVEVARALASLGVIHSFFLDGGLGAYRDVLASERERLARAEVLGADCGVR
jgi:rhodanese-related sulfurtransferase